MIFNGVASSIVQKQATDIGDNVSNSFVFNHNLNTKDVITQVFDNNTFEVVYPNIINDTNNSVTITFAITPANNNYRVIVTG